MTIDLPSKLTAVGDPSSFVFRQPLLDIFMGPTLLEDDMGLGVDRGDRDVELVDLRSVGPFLHTVLIHLERHRNTALVEAGSFGERLIASILREKVSPGFSY